MGLNSLSVELENPQAAYFPGQVRYLGLVVNLEMYFEAYGLMK